MNFQFFPKGVWGKGKFWKTNEFNAFIKNLTR